MNSEKGLVILGFGGHARSVAAVALANGIQSILFVDANAKAGETFLGFPVTQKLERNIGEGWSCIPGSGDNSERRSQFDLAQSAGWPIARIIARNATIDVDARIASGCFVGHHAHVGPSAQIGTGCILNTGAIVDHESIVGDFSHIAVNAVVAGRVRIGSFVFLGAGATIIDSVSVGDRITIGAGATVITSLNTAGTYVGCPARRLPEDSTNQTRGAAALSKSDRD
jgi:UDP-N-acetylbacillosamine N-acetyltransferase